MDLIQRMYFTDENVNQFLVHKLHFCNWKIVLHRDRVEFLTYLQQKHTVHIYFQNIRMAAVPQESRSGPTVEQIIATGFSGRGGACYELNYFLYLLLLSLGFDTILVRSSYGGVEDSHLIPVVRLRDADQEQLQLYMLDVASAHPIDIPIPLHQLPHRRQAGGCWYEYREHVLPGKEGSTHGRYQIGGNWFHSLPEADKDKEKLIFEFDLAPRTLDCFTSARDMFWRPDLSPNFLKRPFLFRYLQLEGMEPDDNNWVLVMGLKVVVARKAERQVTEYMNYEELVPVIWKYFPALESGEMQAAFEVFEGERKNRLLENVKKIGG